METEHNGPKIIGLHAIGLNGIYTFRPSFSLKSEICEMLIDAYFDIDMPDVIASYDMPFDFITFYKKS